MNIQKIALTLCAGLLTIVNVSQATPPTAQAPQQPVVIVQSNSPYSTTVKNIAVIGTCTGLTGIGYLAYDYLRNDGKETRKKIDVSTKFLKHAIKKTKSLVSKKAEEIKEQITDASESTKEFMRLQTLVLLGKIEELSHTAQEAIRTESERIQEHITTEHEQTREEIRAEHEQTRTLVAQALSLQAKIGQSTQELLTLIEHEDQRVRATAREIMARLLNTHQDDVAGPAGAVTERSQPTILQQWGSWIISWRKPKSA